MLNLKTLNIMNRTLIILFILILIIPNYFFASAQSGIDEEMNRMAKSLVTQLNFKKAKRVAVADFTFQGQGNTRIGKYMADLLSNKLVKNLPTFDIVQRDEVRKELSKQQNNTPTQFDYQDAGIKTVDAASKEKHETNQEKNEDIIRAGGAIIEGLLNKSSKALKGTDVIVFGTIEDRGEEIHLIIEATKNNGKKDLIGAEDGTLVKTPTVREMMQDQATTPVVFINNNNNTNGSTTNPQDFQGAGLKSKYENITFEVLGCKQTGRDVECKLNIIGVNKNEELYLHIAGTRIIDAGNSHEFPAVEVALADHMVTRYWAKKTLVSDIPMSANIRFAEVNQSVSSIAMLDMHFGVDGKGQFQVVIKNIPVRQ